MSENRKCSFDNNTLLQCKNITCIAAKQKASILSRHNREGNINKYSFYRGGDSYCSKVKDIFCQAKSCDVYELTRENKFLKKIGNYLIQLPLMI